jgi:hypothetical protein
MRKYTTAFFQKNFAQCLKNAPFELTRYGKSLFLVSKISKSPQDVTEDSKNVTEHFTENVKKTIENENVTEHPGVESICNVQSCRIYGKLSLGTYKEWVEELGEWKTQSMMMCKKCQDKYGRIRE